MEVFYRLLYVAFWSGWRCSLDELWRKCCLREHSNNRNPALHVCSCTIVAVLFFMTQILQVEAMVPVMTLVNRLVRWMAVHLCRNSGKVILMLFAEGKPFSAVTLPKCYCFRFFLPEVGPVMPFLRWRSYALLLEKMILQFSPVHHNRLLLLHPVQLLLEEFSIRNRNLLPLPCAVLSEYPFASRPKPTGWQQQFLTGCGPKQSISRAEMMGFFSSDKNAYSLLDRQHLAMIA